MEEKDYPPQMEQTDELVEQEEPDFLTPEEEKELRADLDTIPEIIELIDCGYKITDKQLNLIYKLIALHPELIESTDITDSKMLRNLVVLGDRCEMTPNSTMIIPLMRNGYIKELDEPTEDVNLPFTLNLPEVVPSFNRNNLDAEYRYRIIQYQRDVIQLRHSSSVETILLDFFNEHKQHYNHVETQAMNDIMWSIIQFGLKMREAKLTFKGISRTCFQCTRCKNQLYHFYYTPNPLIDYTINIMCLKNTCFASDAALLAIFIDVSPVVDILRETYPAEIVNIILMHIDIGYVREWLLEFAKDKKRNPCIIFNQPRLRGVTIKKIRKKDANGKWKNVKPTRRYQKRM